MLEEKTVLTMKQGLQNEMESAYNYIATAAQYGNVELKRQLLGYAMDEILHAQKILDLFDMAGEKPGKIEIELLNSDDLFGYLIEYISREESAVFYYNMLHEFQNDPKLKQICEDIRREEEKHLTKITLILNKLKSGELDGAN